MQGSVSAAGISGMLPFPAGITVVSVLLLSYMPKGPEVWGGSVFQASFFGGSQNVSLGGMREAKSKK